MIKQTTADVATDTVEIASTEKLTSISQQLIQQNAQAYEDLAK